MWVEGSSLGEIWGRGGLADVGFGVEAFVVWWSMFVSREAGLEVLDAVFLRAFSSLSIGAGAPPWLGGKSCSWTAGFARASISVTSANLCFPAAK